MGAVSPLRRKNFTRTSSSIARTLLRRGAVHLLPVYGVLRLSDLAREGIENSGSYRFADHLYAGVPSGRTPVGRLLDRVLLRLPASRAFRRRYETARAEILRALAAAPDDGSTLRVLGVPCGIPRDMRDVAEIVKDESPSLLERIEYHALDIDPEVLVAARRFLDGTGLRVLLHRGDALESSAYPPAVFHVAVSTGLGEFLDDGELRVFYRRVYDALAPGGTFYTSASDRDDRSEMLLQLAEISTHYRSCDRIDEILSELPWSRIRLVQDRSGVQTFVTAVK